MNATHGLRPRFAFTHHAVERFIRRVRPGIDDRAALRALLDASSRARPSARPTRAGQAIWIVDAPPMRFVTKPDAGTIVVVTVVDGTEIAEDEAEHEVLEAYRRLSTARELAEPTRPIPAPNCCGAHVSEWLHVEQQRLGVERKRVKAAVVAEQARIAAAAVEKEREKTVRHWADVGVKNEKCIRYRNDLLRAAATKLRALDADGSAELLGRIDDVLRAEERKDTKRDER